MGAGLGRLLRSDLPLRTAIATVALDLPLSKPPSHSIVLLRQRRRLVVVTDEFVGSACKRSFSRMAAGQRVPPGRWMP
jgi:hypothetical protein